MPFSFATRACSNATVAASFSFGGMPPTTEIFSPSLTAITSCMNPTLPFPLRLRKPLQDPFRTHLFDLQPHSPDLGREPCELGVPDDHRQVRSLSTALQCTEHRVEDVDLYSSES